jgi:DNA-binding beta-propeller fold protein YncE
MTGQRRAVAAVLVSAALLLVAGGHVAHQSASPLSSVAPAAVPGGQAQAAKAGGVPPPLDPHNVYAADVRGSFSSVVRDDRPLIYVPDSGSATVDEIDPGTSKVIREPPVGSVPQHFVPSYDLKTLWVTDDESNSLATIDPMNGNPGRTRSRTRTTCTLRRTAATRS